MTLSIPRSVVAVAALAWLALGAGCKVRHPDFPVSTLGQPVSASEMLAVIDQPGPIEVTTVDSADWKTDMSGLLDLKDPRARAAGIKDHQEAIHVFFHALRHPTRGLYVIDTGVEKNFKEDPAHALGAGSLISKLMKLDAVPMPLGTWLAQQQQPLQGVFFTHLHSDHIMGTRDVPVSAPLYVGPGELSNRSVMNALARGMIEEALQGKQTPQSWAFTRDASGQLAGVLDVFGDKSLFAIWTPGHTPGSTAYLARTPHGPVLFTGDTSHTRWGWEHGVAPGSYTEDKAGNVKSLAQLEALKAAHPKMEVHLGHQ